MKSREALTAALFAAHEAAQDAANDPTPETLRAWRKANKAAEKLLPGFYADRAQELLLRAQRQGFINGPVDA